MVSDPSTVLDVVERVCKIASITAIPFVLAVGGWLIQRQLQSQTVSRDYVQLALTILQNPDQTKVPPEPREWAVELLSHNSPTKLNAKAMESLKSGTVTLPSFNFVPSSTLTPSLKTELESALMSFQSHLAQLGFPTAAHRISVEIEPGITFDGGWVARADLETASIAAASALASDKITVLRQLAHQYLFRANAQLSGCQAIQSGLATYLPCSFLDRPVMGDGATPAAKPFLAPQDVRNNRQLGEIRLEDFSSVQHDGSEIWGGAFWQLRELLGKDDADRLLSETWRAFRPQESRASLRLFATFVNDLVANSKRAGDG